MPKGFRFSLQCYSVLAGFLFITASFSPVFGQGFSLLHQKDATSGSIGALGTSVAIVGDVDGDGKADFIVGAPLSSTAPGVNPGIAFVYSGADGSLLYQKNGAANGDGFGYSVAGTGDVNGDGRADFIVGAPQDIGFFQLPGKAYVYSGADGSPLYEMAPGPGVGGFGASVAGVGDVNGDGKADFIIGAPHFGGPGWAFVYSGADSSLLYQKTGGDDFGYSVAGAGDVNGDSIPDFIIGAPHIIESCCPGIRHAYVYSGADGSLLRDVPGPYGSHFGFSVAGAGDVNGDDTADFIIGDATPTNKPTFNPAGSAYVYSGTDYSLLYQKNGVGPNDGLGASVAGAGDVNGDGYSDFIVGAPQTMRHNLFGPGVVYLYSGFDGSLLSWKDGLTFGGNLGWSVAGTIAGVGQNVGGDGNADFIIGEPSVQYGPAGTGTAYVYALDNRNLTLNSTTDSRLILAPAGNVGFEVTLRDSSGLPVDSSTNAWLDFSEVSGLTVCPSQTYFPLIPPTSPSDANGKLQFIIKAGGCSTDSVKVMTSSGMIAKVPIKSLDHNGGFLITAADFVGDVCNDYDNDGNVGVHDWEYFEIHLNESCIDAPTNFTDLDVFTIPGPAFLFQGDTIDVCGRIVNTLPEVVTLDTVIFSTAGWGIARQWTEFARIYGITIGPLDSINVCQQFVLPFAFHGCWTVEIFPRYGTFYNSSSYPTLQDCTQLLEAEKKLGLFFACSEKKQLNGDTKPCAGGNKPPCGADGDCDGKTGADDRCPGSQCGCAVNSIGCVDNSVEQTVDAQHRICTGQTPSSSLSGYSRLASNPPDYVPDTVFRSFVPIGTEFGDSLLLYRFVFMPAGWSFTVSDSGWVHTPDTIFVEIFHDSIIQCNDSARIIFYAYTSNDLFAGNAEISVNVTVTKGDLNGDLNLSPSDVVLLLNCTFLQTGDCRRCLNDVNCDGNLTPADVVLELNAVFLAAAFPC